MVVSAIKLMNILNKVVTRHPDLKTDGFGIDTCRSMVAVMDSDTTGKLGFDEFKYLWNNIKSGRPYTNNLMLTIQGPLAAVNSWGPLRQQDST